MIHFNRKLDVVVDAACSPRVRVGSLRVLWLPPTVQKHAFGVRLIGLSKLIRKKRMN